VAKIASKKTCLKIGISVAASGNGGGGVKNLA